LHVRIDDKADRFLPGRNRSLKRRPTARRARERFVRVFIIAAVIDDAAQWLVAAKIFELIVFELIVLVAIGRARSSGFARLT
jgi:hypothetical protein